MNVPTGIVLVLIAAALTAAVVHMLRNKNSCAGCCRGHSCDSCDSCDRRNR